MRPLELKKRPVGEGYSTPLGYAPLRERIAVMLNDRSIKVSTSQILFTQGASHALDLLIRHLTKPGDVVLVDSPGYYPLFGKLSLAMVTAVGVRRTPEGPDPGRVPPLRSIPKLKSSSRSRLLRTPLVTPSR